MSKQSLELKEIDLNKLKKFLKHGDLIKISNKTGYSTNYVSRVLNPTDKRINKEIIQEAVKLAEKSEKITISSKFAENVIVRITQI